MDHCMSGNKVLIDTHINLWNVNTKVIECPIVLK